MKKLKQVLINWSVIYVLITILIYVLNGLLLNYPVYLRTAILSGVMVFTMAYLIKPLISKLTKSSKNENQD